MWHQTQKNILIYIIYIENSYHVDPNKFDNLKNEDKDKDEYKILISWDKTDDKSLKCFGDIKLRGVFINYILYVQYEKEIIYHL